MPILAIPSLTRSLESAGKRVSHYGSMAQSQDRRTSRLRDWIGLEGWFSENFEVLTNAESNKFGP